MLFSRFFHIVCAKSLQSCAALCDPVDCSLPGSCPWGSPGKNAGVSCHALLQGGPTQSRDQNPCLFMSPALAGKFFTNSATWETFFHISSYFIFHSFLLPNSILCMDRDNVGYTTFYLFLYQLMDILVSTFWPVINNASMKICVQVFVWMYVFIHGCILESRIAGSYGNCV